MRQRTVPVIGFLVVCLVVLNAVPGTSPQIARSQTSPRFTVTDLGTLGGSTSQALGINDAGQVVGISQTADGHTHAFLWDGTTMIDINCPTCSQSVARAINAVGQVTGWALGISSQYPNKIRAYLYSQNTGMVELSSIAPDDETAGYGLNDLGWVVGHRAQNCPLCFGRPFLHDGTGMRLIGVAQGDGFAVNAAGQVTGDYYFNGVNPHAFVWAPSQTNPTDLGAAAGDPFSTGFSVADDGTIVGTSNQSPGAQHAIMWQPQGSGYNLINLGTTGTFGPHTSSAGISNFGEIVGCVPPTNFGVIAVCDKATGPAFLAAVPTSLVPIMVDIANLLAGTGCTVTGVGAINGPGQYAATGNCGQGAHALLLTPIKAQSANLARAEGCPSGDQKLREARIIVAATVLFALIPDLNVVVATAQFVKSVENVQRQYLICGGDPFDPNFPSVFAPSFHTLPQVTANQCIPNDLVPIVNAHLGHSGRIASYLQAVYMTGNRAQSAYTFGDTQSFSLQDQTIGSYADSLVSEYLAAQTGEQTLAQRLIGSPCDNSVTQADVQTFLDAVRNQGIDALPQIERDLIPVFGVDPTLIVNLLLSVDPARVPTRVVDIINLAAGLDGEFANLYR